MSEKGFSADLLDFEQRAERYAVYMRELGKKRFTTGLPALDGAIRGVAPGEVMTIIAYSGTYKSAYLQNLLQQAAMKTRRYQIMFSMEMPVEKCFEREIQIATGEDGWTVEKEFRALSAEAQEMTSVAIQQGSKFLLVCEKPRLTLERITKYVDVARAKYGEIGTVGIDYLGLMKGEGKTLFDRMAELSYGLKELAKSLMVPVVVLGQVNRGYANSKEIEIEMDAAKGGGDIEAGADFMLGLMQKDGDIIMKLLKNRNGRKDLYFRVDIDRRSLRFLGIEEIEPPKQKKGKSKEEGPF